MKINWHEFMDTTDEFHAFIIGAMEVLCPWRPRITIISQELAKAIKDEYHYYQTGRGIGFVTLLLVLTGIAKLVLSML